MSEDFKLVPGGAIRIRHYTEFGTPHLVEVTPAICKRAEYLRIQYLGCEDLGDSEPLCAIFRDPTTDEVYGQPIEAPPE